MNTSCRKFDWDDHQLFARTSCDYNPMHMDEIAARRTHAGQPILHGIHGLLWLLDCLSARTPRLATAKSLKVQFPQPIYVGDEVTFDVVESTSSVIRAQLAVGAEAVLVAAIGFDELHVPTLAWQPSHHVATPAPDRPRELAFDEMMGASGRLSFSPALDQISAHFPHAVSMLGMHRIAALICSSCLVGMVLPGLHSLFSGLEVSLCDDASEPLDSLRFSVLSTVPRFRLVRVGVSTQGLRGSLETINRLPPIVQPGMDRVSTAVFKDEFRGSSALIVGGSRGLGELTAKLIGAGGGDVAITYATGARDAQQVAEEIRRFGSQCTPLAYDVRRPARAQLNPLTTTPTHLYYFATPSIFRRKAGLFDQERFEEFNSFYVTGFFDLAQVCLSLSPNGVRVFYPSSSALDDRPANMTEYSMSKAAAEVLCADLSKFVPGITVLTRRLPRLPTDQTSSVVQVETADPVEVMLAIVREMHR